MRMQAGLQAFCAHIQRLQRFLSGTRFEKGRRSAPARLESAAQIKKRGRSLLKLEKTPRTCAGALPYARASERTRLRFSARPVQTHARHPPGKKALRRKAPWRGLHAWRDSILRLCDGETTHGARAARMATPGGSDRMRARARFVVAAPRDLAFHVRDAAGRALRAFPVFLLFASWRVVKGALWAASVTLPFAPWRPALRRFS